MTYTKPAPEAEEIAALQDRAERAEQQVYALVEAMAGKEAASGLLNSFGIVELCDMVRKDQSDFYGWTRATMKLAHNEAIEAASKQAFATQASLATVNAIAALRKE